MPIRSFKPLRALALAGLVLGSTAFVRANGPGQEGVVRITSSPSATAAAPVSFDQAAWGHGPVYGGGPVHQGWSTCPPGYHGGYYGPHWGRCLSKIVGPNHCTVSPDHGFCLPAKRPIYRIPVEYHRYWPLAWYGSPEYGTPVATAPQIYMPTDTTQLGYYYQVTPTWRPAPGMLPPRPIPAVWHIRDCDYPRMTGYPVPYVGAAPVTPVSAPATVPPQPAGTPQPATGDVNALLMPPEPTPDPLNHAAFDGRIQRAEF